MIVTIANTSSRIVMLSLGLTNSDGPYTETVTITPNARTGMSFDLTVEADALKCAALKKALEQESVRHMVSAGDLKVTEEASADEVAKAKAEADAKAEAEALAKADAKAKADAQSGGKGR